MHTLDVVISKALSQQPVVFHKNNNNETHTVPVTTNKQQKREELFSLTLVPTDPYRQWWYHPVNTRDP